MTEFNASSDAAPVDPVTGAAPWNMKVDGDVLALSGTVDFSTARAILESVQSELKSGGPGVIDLAGVTRINSAGLAVMIEWLSVARRLGINLSFRNVPEALRKLARVCQVDELLPVA